MGILGSWPGGAAAGVPPTGAGYAALLATARAAASEGDWYEDSQTGAAFRYYAPSGSQGVLVPASVYDSVNGYVSNASGIAEWTLADDEDTDNDLTNRGWVISLSNSGTFTKVADSAAVLDSGTTNNGTSNPKFIPTALPAKSLSVLRLTLTDPPPNNSSCPFYLAVGATTYLRFEMTTSAEDGRSRFWDGSAQDGGGIITQGVGNDRTIFVAQDSSSGDGSISAWCLETGEFCVAQRDQIIQAGTTASSFVAVNLGGTAVNQTILGVYEWHWIELT